MIENLLRLDILTGIEKYRETAKKLINTVIGKAWEYPSMYIGVLTAAMDADNLIELIISPKGGGIMVKEVMVRLAHIYAPNLVTILVDKFNNYLPQYAKAIYQSGSPGYYLCKGGACRPPLNNIEEVISQILEH